MSASPDVQSRRVVAAAWRARQRLWRQRGTLRPLGWAVIALVAASTMSGRPAPGLGGAGVGVAVALGVFVLAMAVAVSDRFLDRGPWVQSAVIAAMGGGGVALAWLQPGGASGLAAAAAVWMALTRLRLRTGVALGAAITLALDAAAARSGGSLSSVAAATLLCVLLGLVATFLRQARAGQDRTEMLLAQLEDAREDRERAAAIAERGRIAGELHDVLAHSLSAAAIQLQGARVLAERDRAGPQLRGAIERASRLIADGLTDARHAVGALRGQPLPTLAQLGALVDGFTRDTNLNATFSIEGEERALPAEASLALYRGAQEALTNVARHAPGAPTTLVLRYHADHTTLSVENRLPTPVASAATRTGTQGGGPAGDLSGVGGGRGLTGLRERLERAGGSLRAGPTGHGWRVEAQVPA